METTLVALIQSLGLPVAALVAIGWFIAFKVWPYYISCMDTRQKADEEQRASITKALSNNSEVLFNLVKVTVELRTALEAVSSSLHDLHDSMGSVQQDVAALYERTGWNDRLGKKSNTYLFGAKSPLYFGI